MLCTGTLLSSRPNSQDRSNRISDAITQFDHLVPVGLAMPTSGGCWEGREEGRDSIKLCITVDTHSIRGSLGSELDRCSCTHDNSDQAPPYFFLALSLSLCSLVRGKPGNESLEGAVIEEPLQLVPVSVSFLLVATPKAGSGCGRLC